MPDAETKTYSPGVRPTLNERRPPQMLVALRFICIRKLDGLGVAVHIERFLLRGAVASKVVGREAAIAALGFGLVARVTQRLEVFGSLTAVLGTLIRHVNFVSGRRFYQTRLTGPVLGLMGALVAPQQSGSQPQAWSWEILHVAVVHHCNQEEEEEQEKEEEEGHAVVALQILRCRVLVVWTGYDGVWGKVPARL